MLVCTGQILAKTSKQIILNYVRLLEELSTRFAKRRTASASETQRLCDSMVLQHLEDPDSTLRPPRSPKPAVTHRDGCVP